MRELKARLGHYLALVQAGETVVVTARGKPVAKLQSVEKPEEPPESVRHLIEAGKLVWRPKSRIDLDRPGIKMLPGEKTSTDFVREQRR